MTRERIKDFREVLLPFVKKRLLAINYGGRGKSDAEEFTREFNEILDLATKVLEQEPCEDAISRQAVEDAIYDATRSMDLNYGQIMDYIDKLPSVTPKPKNGHWIDVSGGCECSECGCLEAGYSSYCPDCGAKMEEVENG